MGELLKLVLVIYVISLIIALVGAFIKFLADVHKWHDREERVTIEPSNLEEPEEEKEEEREVIEDDTNSGEHNTSAFSLFGN